MLYKGLIFFIFFLISVHFTPAFKSFFAGTQMILAFIHLFTIFSFYFNYRTKKFSPLFFIIGYSIILYAMIFFYSPPQPLMFALLCILFIGTFHNQFLSGMFWIFFISITAFQEYWFYVFVIMTFWYILIINLRKTKEKLSSSLFFLTGFLFLMSILFPLFHLMFQSTPQTLMIMLKEKSFQNAVYNSLITSFISAGVLTLLGIPLAYAMVRLNFPGKKLIDSMIDIPVLIPQTIAGIAILNILGPKTTLGNYFINNWNISVSGTFLGIILCQIFVSTPYLVRSAMNGFERVPCELENLSRTLGAGRLSTFFRVSLPLCKTAIFDGFILAWARSISEFGSVMILAQFPSTIPVYTFEHYVRYGLSEARPISVLLVIICLWLFIGLRFIRNYHWRTNAGIK